MVSSLSSELSDMNTKELVPRKERKHHIGKKRNIKQLRKALHNVNSIVNGMTRKQSYLLRYILCHDQWKLIAPHRILRKGAMLDVFRQRVRMYQIPNYHAIRRNCPDMPASTVAKMIAHETGEDLTPKQALILIKQISMKENNSLIIR